MKFLVLLMVVACLLGTGPNLVAAANDNPFTGSWEGTFENSVGVSGELVVSFSQTGVLIGALEDSNGNTGTLHGRIRPDGVFTAVLVPLGDSYMGQASIDANGDLVGAFTIRGTDVTGTFRLSPK